MQACVTDGLKWFRPRGSSLRNPRAPEAEHAAHLDLYASLEDEDRSCAYLGCTIACCFLSRASSSVYWKVGSLFGAYLDGSRYCSRVISARAKPPILTMVLLIDSSGLPV